MTLPFQLQLPTNYHNNRGRENNQAVSQDGHHNGPILCTFFAQLYMTLHHFHEGLRVLSMSVAEEQLQVTAIKLRALLLSVTSHLRSEPNSAPTFPPVTTDTCCTTHAARLSLCKKGLHCLYNKAHYSAHRGKISTRAAKIQSLFHN